MHSRVLGIKHGEVDGPRYSRVITYTPQAHHAVKINDGRGMWHVRVEETRIQDFGAAPLTVHLWGGGVAAKVRRDEVLPSSVGMLRGGIPAPVFTSRMRPQGNTFHWYLVIYFR
jgi:hypothetical protein